MPKAVSNASPLIHLAKINRLELIREFHEQVLVPPAVWREVVERGHGQPETPLILQACREGWIQQKAVSEEKLISLLKLQLDEGESETIALAIQERADIVLLDDSEARLVANQLNLRVTGVIGILIRAKKEAKIPSLKIELERLRTEGRFWVTERIIEQALLAVGEVGEKDVG
jgi:predicted nucleic acid-binding protein